MAGILVSMRSDHRAANRIMASLILVMTLLILQRLYLRDEFTFQHPAAVALIAPLAFTLGPLLYLYAHSLTGGVLRRRQWTHFLPALLLLCASGSFWTLSPEGQSQIVTYFWGSRNDPALREAARTAAGPILWVWGEYHLYGSLFTLQLGLYCLLILRQIRDHNSHLQNNLSSLEHMNLRWLRGLTLALLVFLLLFILFNRLYLVLEGQLYSSLAGLRIPLVYMVVIIYAIAISAIFQPSLVSGIAQPGSNDDYEGQVDADESANAVDATQFDLPPAPANVDTEKYAHSGLRLADSERFRLMLVRTMEEEQLYLNSELTLPDLVRHTGLSPNLVSQIMNKEMKQNFFNFVNGYRIQLAMEMLTDTSTRDLPIVELAVEVGFKSKSSFYDAFKRVTQMTPTQFKKAEAL